MSIILDGTTGITTPDLIDSSLTSGRVVYAGASGNLTGASGFTFDGANVIINATTPAYFTGTSNLAQISINRSPSTGVIFNASQSAAFVNIDGDSGGSSFQFATASAANTQPSEKMRLTGAGSLCVGSTSAGDAGTVTVSIGNPGTTAGGLQLWATSAQEHYIQWGDSTSGSATYAGAISYAHASDFMRFWTTSTERMRLTSTGLGIGTSSPAAKLHVEGGTENAIIGSSTRKLYFRADSNGVSVLDAAAQAGNGFYVNSVSSYVATYTGSAERMRVDATNGLQVGTSAGNCGANGIHATGVILQGTSGLYQAQIAISGGNTIQASTLGVGYEPLRLNPLGSSVLINCTATPSGSSGGTGFVSAGAYGVTRLMFSSTSTATVALLQWDNPNGNIGSISISGSSTSYNTSSDYRLKNTITPMTGALAKVALLKPCTYKWNADNSDGEGFIAHELAEVCPHAVSGDKDAVDADGNIKSQGIDTSFLVATLTAAIQEQQAIIESLKARLDAANL